MNVASMLKSKGNDVVTTSPDASLHDVAKLLAMKKIGSVVVIDENEKLCGIISERDIVRQIAADGVKALGVPVSQTMTSKVITCRTDDTVEHIMEEMTAGRFRHVPVVSDGRLVGIISIGDVVKRRIAEAEFEASAMREYIATG